MVVLICFFAACGGESAKNVSKSAEMAIETVVPPALIQETIVAGYTYLRSDGNRLVDGKGNFPSVPEFRLDLPGDPAWIAAVPSGDTSVWAVIMDDGQVVGFRVTADGVERTNITPARLPSGQPPLLLETDGVLRLITAVDPDASPLTHPVLLPAKGGIGFLRVGGDITFKGGIIPSETNPCSCIDLDAVQDSRLISRDGSKLLVLSDATTRYSHGVLSDNTEAASLTIILVRPPFPVVQEVIKFLGSAVIEGQSPIWEDLDGDGEAEILLTVSDEDLRSRLVAYREDGIKLAESSGLETGHLWRHQIAIGRFGPEGEIEVAAVRAPHTEGIVEFFRWEGDRLHLVAELPGYSSHIRGSRNLDMALAGDLNGDGQIELVVPNQAFTRLMGVQRTISGAEEVWSIELGGRLTTNLAAVENVDGTITFGAGIEDGVLLIWRR